MICKLPEILFHISYFINSNGFLPILSAIVLLSSQTSSEKGTLGYDISRPDTQYGGNVYFNKIKNSLYEGPIAVFTTPSYITTTYPSYFLRSVISYCIDSGIQLKLFLDEGDACLRSTVNEISLSTVLQKKDCRQSKGYSTTNINSNESFLPINNSISPSKTPDEGIITSFLKVSQINKNSFEEFEFGRPDDFCYLVNGEEKFTDTPGNLHLDFAYSGTAFLAYEVVFKISKIFIIIPNTTDVQNRVSLVRFDRQGGEVILNPDIVNLIR